MFRVQNNFLYRAKDVHFQLTEMFAIYRGFPFISLGSISGLPIKRKGFTNGMSGSFLFVVVVVVVVFFKLISTDNNVLPFCFNCFLRHRV